MNKIFTILALAIIALTSCRQDVGGDIDTPSKLTSITINAPATRTELGGKSGDYYPLYWSDEDKIVVNGAASTSSLISDDRTSATFYFDSDKLAMPYHLSYPYTEGSSCAEGNTTVVFNAEQHYVEGSFGVGDAPMYGYCDNLDNQVAMKHLAGVVRLAIKGAVTISTIEIVADESIALAGEFKVDCKTGTMTALEGKTTNSITYIADKQLSDDEESIFHIALPAGNLGECKVVVNDCNGCKMNMKWNAKDVARGIVREMKSFTFQRGVSFELENMTSEEDDDLFIPGNLQFVCGYIRYEDGSPAVGVSVSDGFSVVKTDLAGFYNFVDGVDKRTKYIYYSIPTEAKIATNSKNYLDFFQPYQRTKTQYDFTLVKGEKEKKFALFVIADTHGSSITHINRLKAECFPGVKREAEARSDVPCYTIVLGDIVCTTYINSSGNALQPGYMEDMRNLFGERTGGVPTIFVMGNHDYSRDHFDNPQYYDFDLFNYHAQDTYEEKFGPANYSINRGDTHIISMRDILWPESCITEKTSAGCYGGFLEEQIEWLRQDLANVTKDKKVILCVHIPLVERYDNDKYPTVNRVVDMIKDYNEPQIFSGHTHTNRDYRANSTNFSYTSPVSEKTIVGNWGTGAEGTQYGRTLKCMGDGAPFGFDVYDVSGANFTDHYFVDCTSNKSHKRDTDYVMRAYLSSDVYGGDCDGDGEIYTNTSHLSHERYFRFYQATSEKYTTYLHVNIFNGSPDTWSVKLYVNNKFVKDLTWREGSKSYGWRDFAPTAYTWKGQGSGTFDNPWYPSSANTQDWWYIAYMVNETTATGDQTINNTCHHKWYGYVPNASLNDIKAGNFYIEATHTEFGQTKVYRSNKIFGQDDYNGYMNYKPKNN